MCQTSSLPSQVNTAINVTINPLNGPVKELSIGQPIPATIVELRDPAAFKPYQAQEIETWIKIAKDAGIQPEE